MSSCTAPLSRASSPMIVRARGQVTDWWGLFPLHCFVCGKGAVGIFCRGSHAELAAAALTVPRTGGTVFACFPPFSFLRSCSTAFSLQACSDFSLYTFSCSYHSLICVPLTIFCHLPSCLSLHNHPRRNPTSHLQWQE